MYYIYFPILKQTYFSRLVRKQQKGTIVPWCAYSKKIVAMVNTVTIANIYNNTLYDN